MLKPLPFVNAFPQNRGSLLSRASSVRDQWSPAKQYNPVFKLFCMTFTQVKTIYLDWSSAIPMPSNMPVSSGWSLLPAWWDSKNTKFGLLDKAFSHKNLFLSNPFCLLCTFLFLQNSYSAVYFPHATEFIWTIGFPVSALLFWLLLEVERPKLHE